MIRRGRSIPRSFATTSLTSACRWPQMCNENFREPRERVLMKNIATAGVLIELLNIDRRRRRSSSSKKSTAARKACANRTRRRCSWAPITFASTSPARCPSIWRRWMRNDDKILIDGNTAAALGCVYAGATVAAWYPITPSTSTMDAFKVFCERFRKDKETGENNYLILQAEDELAAIGMVIGASWNGARAFTSTAGPGISLMNELLGLAYYAEIPAVVIDVQRVGPSTGMPTRTQQGDILECAYASHGDTKHILLFPANPAECFELAAKSFDLAEQLPDARLHAVRSRYRHERLGHAEAQVGRFLPPRPRPRPDRRRARSDAEVLPLSCRKTAAPSRRARCPASHPKGAFFTRGSGHNKFGGYTEIPDEYQEVMDRLLRKHKEAAGFVPAPIIEKRKGARVGIITVGGCDPAVREALDILAEQGSPMDYMRIRAFPVRRTGGSVHRRTRFLLRGRAESRRAASLAADS